MVRIIKSGLALALLLGVSVANAAGLGKLSVMSALGQVLNAEIDLVSVQPGELDSLTARVAAPEAFRDARIEYAPSLRLLRFSVDKRLNGQPYLKVSSVAPINEPFLDVLIEVSWPAGRIQREYPILLDPPGYSQKGSPPTVAAAPSRAPETSPATAPASSSSTPAPTPAESGAATSVSGAPSAQAELAATTGGAAPAAVREPGADTYGPVQRGDTLHKIAEETKPSSVSLEQMLVALYRENKSAFSGNNMNRLKTGQILKVPTADEVAQIETKDAYKEIRTHVSDWKAYREQLAGGVSAIPARSDSTNVSSGRIASAAVTPPAPPSAEPKDVLKLSKTDSGKSGAGKGGAANQDRINALQEEVIAKDKALKESQSRVADLEKQIRDMQRVLDLKASVAGKAETKVAAAPPPVKAPEPPPKVAEAPKAEEKPAEAPKQAEAPKAEVKPAEPPKPAEEPKVAAAPKAETPKAPPKKAPPPPKSWTDELLDNPWIIGAGVFGVAAIGVIGFVVARRRKDRLEAGPTSSMTSAFPSDLKPNTTTGKSGGGLVDTGNSSFLTDFDKTGPGTIDTDEVDPVAEAEVYIAYGRDAQAEEILKEAMARDKNRHEIALKLLEIYHARKSATAFETVAKELRSAVGESHPLWQKAAAMGAQIDPTNPLYVAAAAGTATFTAMSSPAPAAAKPNLDFDLDTSSSAQSGAAAPAPDFDLDLDAKRSDASGHEQPAGGSGLDFDLAPTPAEQHAADATAHAAAEEAKEEKPAFDFDLSGLDFPSSSKPAAAAAPPPKAGSGSSNVDLADLSLESPAESGGGEAVGTKLELAKAYLEIGDKDGAREILQEVAKEGSSAQRDEAKKLIASL
ncbi:MAG: FimV/HubP family polar landmark protein [Usitatibacter sp.]